MKHKDLYSKYKFIKKKTNLELFSQVPDYLLMNRLITEQQQINFVKMIKSGWYFWDEELTDNEHKNTGILCINLLYKIVKDHEETKF